MVTEYDAGNAGETTPAEQTMVLHDPRLEQKFTQVPHEVTFMRGLSRDAKHTYTILLSYAWKHNKCFPGMATLCGDLEASEPTARKFLRELQACRLIRIERRGLQKTNLYHFLPVAEASTASSLSVVPPRTMSPERKARFNQERKGLERKTRFAQERKPDAVQERKRSFTPIKEEEYTEGRIHRGKNIQKGSSASHDAGASAPAAAQEMPTSAPAATAQNEVTTEQKAVPPQYQVFLAKCTAAGSAPADMDGHRGRDCADAAKALKALTARYAGEGHGDAAGAALADMCALVTWKVADYRRENRRKSALPPGLVWMAYQDMAAWRAAGCPGRPAPEPVKSRARLEQDRMIAEAMPGILQHYKDIGWQLHAGHA